MNVNRPVKIDESLSQTISAHKTIAAYGPDIGIPEIQAINRALTSGQLVGAGPISRRVEGQMAEVFGVAHVLLTASCTAALEMAVMALELGPGDEVILPSFTFVSTANCLVLRGVRPVFADICPETLNLDPADVERRITPRTRAILLVHYAGIGCDMDAFQRLADKRNLALIEDAAQGVDAQWRGRYLGTMGSIGCYSFHATKNLTCGEGGAFLTNDATLAHRAEIIREKGTNRAAFLRGEIDKYTWVAPGSSYILSDLLAALLECQLQRRELILTRRRHVWESYQQGLTPLAQAGKLHLAVNPPEARSNYHIFYLRTRTPEEQDALLNYLKGAGVPASFHYVPLHTSPFGRSLNPHPLSLPVTEQAAATLVRLPIGTHLCPEQAEHVVNTVLDFYTGQL